MTGLKCEKFSDNFIAGRLCEEFSKRSIPAEKIDINSDGDVSLDELLDHGFNNYGGYTALLNGLLPRNLPWILDEASLARVRAAAGELRRILSEQGLQKESSEYDRKLAIGLYYFTLLPDASHISKIDDKKIFDLTIELEKEGLGGFIAYLKANGGLGVYDFVGGDGALEASASEALDKKAGACTERSSILFAVFHVAGLKPFFAYMSGLDVEEIMAKFWDIRGYAKMPYETTDDHILLGLEIGGQMAYFDMAVQWPNAFALYPPDKVLKISLRHFFIASTSSNLIQELFNRGEKEKAKEAYRAIKMLGSPILPSDNLLAEAIFIEDRRALIDILRQAISKDGRDIRLYLKLANLLIAENDMRGADSVLKKALKIDPKSKDVLRALTLIYAGSERVNEAVEFLERLLDIDPDDMIAHIYKGAVLRNNFQFDDAEREFKKVFKIDPTYYLTAVDIAEVYRRRGGSDQEIVWARRALLGSLLAYGETDESFKYRVRIAEREIDQNHLDKAQSQIRKMTDQFVKRWGTAEEAARLKLQQMKWAEAIDIVDKWRDANMQEAYFPSLIPGEGFHKVYIAPTISYPMQFMYYDAKWHLKERQEVADWAAIFKKVIIKDLEDENLDGLNVFVTGLEKMRKNASPEFLNDRAVKDVLIAAYFGIAERFKEGEKWREVIGVYQRLLQFAPDHAPAYKETAEAYSAMGFSREAKEFEARYAEMSK